jgi:subtilisin family serine protease
VGGAGDGTGKTAWVIDSGIDLSHPDLNTSRNCHTYFAGTSPSDGNGHGTHVAGTIAARNNGQDVVGVAANAFVCSVRVLGNSGSGSWEGVVNGVNYVAANGASGDVANMSLGGSGSNATLEKAISDAAGRGIRFVLAAGNEGVDAGTTTPSRVNGNNIYTISAIDSGDCMPSWSNWGNPPVDFAAPGVSILSTRKGGGTTSMSGTSMAAPHAAGVLLLGSARTSGSARCDRDGSPDPIISR